MTDVDERADLQYALNQINESMVWDIPTDGLIADYQCPLCSTPLIESLSFEEMEKIKTWTVAQMIAWHKLQKRSGIDAHELLARTSGGQGEYLGVQDFHGMFIGIEKDGYTHS